MANVLIVVYLLIVIALIAVILLQRSEGGGLGMGGNAGGLVSARGAGNVLTRATAILASLFMLTAIALTILNDIDRPDNLIVEQAAENDITGGRSVLDALNDLQPTDGSDLALPGATESSDEAVDPAPSEPVTESNSDLALPTPEEPAETETQTPNN